MLVAIVFAPGTHSEKNKNGSVHGSVWPVHDSVCRSRRRRRLAPRAPPEKYKNMVCFCIRRNTSQSDQTGKSFLRMQKLVCFYTFRQMPSGLSLAVVRRRPRGRRLPVLCGVCCFERPHTAPLPSEPLLIAVPPPRAGAACRGPPAPGPQPRWGQG